MRRQEEKNRLLRGATNIMANIDTEFENDAYENYEDIYNEQIEYLKIRVQGKHPLDSF